MYVYLLDYKKTNNPYTIMLRLMVLIKSTLIKIKKKTLGILIILFYEFPIKCV